MFCKQYLFSFLRIVEMGAEANCCTTKANLYVNGQLEEKVSQKISNNEFYETVWPTDPKIQSSLAKIKHNQKQKELINKHKIYRHKYLDKFYIGSWNVHGDPEGMGIVFQPDYYLYFGELKNKPNGNGTLELFNEKITYEGSFKQGNAEGEGKIYDHNKKLIFQGLMHNSYPLSGTLEIINQSDPKKSSIITLTNFPHEKTKIKYGDGRIYQGFVNKRTFSPENQGVAYFLDTSHYDGYWELGQMHGKGVFYWKDGSSYEGQYQHGRKHGRGTFHFTNRNYYVGEWAYGKQNGQGKIFISSGKLLKEGTWKDGNFLTSHQN